MYSGGRLCPCREIGQPRPRHTPALQMIKRDNQNTTFTMIAQNIQIKSQTITFEELLAQQTIWSLNSHTFSCYVALYLLGRVGSISLIFFSSVSHCRPIQVLWFLGSQSQPVWQLTALTIGTRTGPKQLLMLPPHRWVLTPPPHTTSTLSFLGTPWANDFTLVTTVNHPRKKKDKIRRPQHIFWAIQLVRTLLINMEYVPNLATASAESWN